MPAKMKRAEAKKQIRAAVLALLKAEQVEGGRLENIKTIIEGERVRMSKDYPLLACLLYTSDAADE